MRLLFLLCLWFQTPPTIDFPEGIRPPREEIEEAPQPPEVDEFSTDELYLIQSDSGLHVIPSPPGVVQVTAVKSGSVIFSKFAGGRGLEERQVTRANGYVLRGLAAGSVELIILPAGSQDLSDMRRRVLTVKSIQQVDPITPKPDIPADDVAAAFRAYERAWRAAQGDLADRLERGEITSEAMAAEWFGAANLQARKDSFLPLLRAESVAFGGDGWTAQKQAAWIRRYANAGK
jgi:hypothetical protein